MEQKNKQDSFKVPKGYFKSLEKDLLAIPEKKKGKSINLWVYSSISIAASFLVALMLFPSLFNNSTNSINQNGILVSYLIEADDDDNIIDLAIEIESEKYLSDEEVINYFIEDESFTTEDIINNF